MFNFYAYELFFVILYHMNFSLTNNIPIYWVPFYKEEDKLASSEFSLYVCVIWFLILKNHQMSCHIHTKIFLHLIMKKWQLHVAQCVSDPNNT
jgi:hypothetical protein